MADEKREELGRLSWGEVDALHPTHHGGAYDYADNCEACTELVERDHASEAGAPGVHPMLSRAQVVAVLGPLREDYIGSEHDYEEGALEAIDDCARALLALPSDAPSPLGDA